MREASPKISLRGKILQESEKAIKIEVAEIAGETLDRVRVEWFPFSQVDKITHPTPGSEELATLTVSIWIMQQKGYDYE